MLKWLVPGTESVLAPFPILPDKCELTVQIWIPCHQSSFSNTHLLFPKSLHKLCWIQNRSTVYNMPFSKLLPFSNCNANRFALHTTRCNNALTMVGFLKKCGIEYLKEWLFWWDVWEMNFNQLCMTNPAVKGLRISMTSLYKYLFCYLGVISTSRN